MVFLIKKLNEQCGREPVALKTQSVAEGYKLKHLNDRREEEENGFCNQKQPQSFIICPKQSSLIIDIVVPQHCKAVKGMRCVRVRVCILMPESGPQPQAHPLSLEGLRLKHTQTAINTHSEAMNQCTHTHLHPNIWWDSADFLELFRDIKESQTYKRQRLWTAAKMH